MLTSKKAMPGLFSMQPLQVHSPSLLLFRGLDIFGVLNRQELMLLLLLLLLGGTATVPSPGAEGSESYHRAVECGEEDGVDKEGKDQGTPWLAPVKHGVDVVVPQAISASKFVVDVREHQEEVPVDDIGPPLEREKAPPGPQHLSSKVMRAFTLWFTISVKPEGVPSSSH